MKISLNWLTDYVDVGGMAAGELVALLTRIGLCWEGTEETEADVVLDVEVTSNRPDCLGHIGVAREIAAALGLELRLPDLGGVPTAGGPASELTSVEVLDPLLCPRYTARIIRGVKVGPSPAWMAERLAAVGMRSINNVVDATNYVLMEYSQPLHAFDHGRLTEGRIVVRRARPGEDIVSIDGTRCELTGEMLVIADAEKPVAVAGIMGGLDSEVGEKTTTILMESARFDPLSTRRTARRLGIMTESSHRFERGVDPVGVEAASLRACQLVLRTAGGQLAEGLVDVWSQPFRPRMVALRPERCRAVLGADIDDRTQRDLLARLGLSPAPAGGKMACTIPSYRADLTREIDLIEEVARLHGYDKVPTGQKVAHGVVTTPPGERVRRQVREVLAAAGFDEAVTFSFVDDAEAALFGFEGGVRVDAGVRRTNNLLRPHLLPSLLRACKTNQDAGNEDVSLYELAAVFRAASPEGAGGLPDERVELALVTQRELPFLRGAVEAVVAKVSRAARVEIAPAEAAGLAEAAAAEVRLDGEPVGVIGMVAGGVLDYYGLKRPQAAATVRFDALLARAGERTAYAPVPRFPAIRRDLSVIVAEEATWGELAEAIASAGRPGPEAVEYVGTYRGQPVPGGKKSVTLTLTYRSDSGTLRHEEVDEMVARAVGVLGERLGAVLRS